MVMAIDSFTMYPEAAAIKTKTPGEVEDFFFRDVVCRYNVRDVVTDHGTEFEGDFDAMCTDLGLMRKPDQPTSHTVVDGEGATEAVSSTPCARCATSTHQLGHI